MTTDPRMEAITRTLGPMSTGFRQIIAKAIAVADEVMFSEEAIELVAEAIYMSSPAGSDKHWENIGKQRQKHFLSRARVVVAVLRGGVE